jgi:hypothetical protein
MTARSQCSAGPCFCQATGVPVFLIPGNNPGERSAARRTVKICTARHRVLPSPGGAGRALPGIVATDAENAHARRRSTGGDFCPRDCSNETPDKALSPAAFAAFVRAGRPPMAGPRNRAGQRPEASRSVSVSHAAGAAPAGSGFPRSGPVKLLHHQDAS